MKYPPLPRAHLYVETLRELRNLPRVRADVFDRGNQTFFRLGAAPIVEVVITDTRERVPGALREAASSMLPRNEGVFTWPVLYRLARLTWPQRRRLATQALAAGDIPAALGILKARR